MFRRNSLILSLPAIAFAALIALGFASCGSQPSIAEKPGIEPAPVAETEPVISPKEKLLQEILQCLRTKDFDGALSLFDEFPPEEAALSSIRLLKTSVLVSAGRFSAARAEVNAVIAGDPSNADAYYTLSRIEAGEGNERGQRAAIDNALKVDGAHAPSLVALGNIYLRNESWRSAGEQFDKALAASPSDLGALTGRAEVYRAQGQMKQALAMADKAVALHSGERSAYVSRSRVHRTVGNMAAALADLTTAENLAPADYWIAYDRARVLLLMGRKDEALLGFKKAVSLNSEEFVAYIYSAGLMADAGDYEGAEAHYRKLSELNPDYFYAYEGLGMLLMKRKNYAGARDAFARAYAKAPDESGYAVLTALSALRVQKQFELKPFLETVLKTAKRGTLSYSMLRLLAEFSGDAAVARQVENEKDPLLKSKMAFYMAEFYDITNKPALANAYYEKCREVNRRDTIEWRLNQWKMEERNLLVVNY